MKVLVPFFIFLSAISPLLCQGLEDPSLYFESVADSDRATYDVWLEENGSQYVRNTFLSTGLGSDAGAAVFWKFLDEDPGTVAVQRSEAIVQGEGQWIQFAIAVQATGWVGFGLSEAGGMLGSDVVTFEASDPNVIVDSYILENRAVLVDDCQDWRLVSSETSGGWLIVEMARPLDTFDTQDIRINNDELEYMAPTRLIAAWGDDDTVGYHAMNRSGKAVRLFSDGGSASLQETLVRLDDLADGYFDVRESNFSIPADDTTYHHICRTREEILAELGLTEADPVTLIGFGAVLSEATQPYVHHFVVQASPSDQGCDGYGDMIGGWAPGEVGSVLPENVGIPLFGDSPHQNIILQIHYNNPELISGLKDSSGMRFFYTMEPREHEAGFLAIGDPGTELSGTPIGEGISQWTLSCGGSCSSLALKGEPVTILEESLHMHQSGTRMVNEVIRGGQVVHTGKVEVYEFAFQGSFRVQQDAFEVQPGDSFRTTCYFRDGSEFGLSSQQEMCVAFLLYYPAKRLQFGHFDVGWHCAYGTGFGLCESELESSDVVAETGLGRIFGVPKGDTCGIPPPNKEVFTSSPKESEDAEDGSEASSAPKWSGTSVVQLGLLASFLQLLLQMV